MGKFIEIDSRLVFAIGRGGECENGQRLLLSTRFLFWVMKIFYTKIVGMVVQLRDMVYVLYLNKYFLNQRELPQADKGYL